MHEPEKRDVGGLLIVLAVVILLGIGLTATAAEQTFPAINKQGYRTVFVLVNPTDEPIAVPDFYRPIQVGSVPVVVGAKSTYRYDGWPRPDYGGVVTLDVPAGLDAYVEIWEPTGVFLRTRAFGAPVTQAFFADLQTGAEFNNYIFLYAPAGTYLTIRMDQESIPDTVGRVEIDMRRGEILIFEVPHDARSAFVKNDNPSNVLLERDKMQPWMAFAFSTHKPTHNMILVPQY